MAYGGCATYKGEVEGNEDLCQCCCPLLSIMYQCNQGHVSNRLRTGLATMFYGIQVH
jgi:hypothetical protein